MANSYTLACLRWTTPKPSLTNASAKAASSLAKTLRVSGSLLVSASWNLRFSRTATSPAERAPATFFAWLPMVSEAKTTSCPKSSPSLAATGARENSLFVSPSGLPR